MTECGLPLHLHARREFTRTLVERIESFDQGYVCIVSQATGQVLLNPRLGAFYEGIDSKSRPRISILTDPNCGIRYAIASNVRNSLQQLEVTMPFSESNLIQLGRYYKTSFGTPFKPLIRYYGGL
jgi:hypothetical protein